MLKNVKEKVLVKPNSRIRNIYGNRLPIEIEKILEEIHSDGNETGVKAEEEEEGDIFFPFPFPENGSDKEVLEKRGIIFINEPISKNSLYIPTRKLLTLHFDENFTEEIQIIINSPGGYLNACWAFIDMMNFIDNPIRTIAMGEICSAAAMIFVSGDLRIMTPNSVAMIHQFSAGSEGTYSDLVADRKSQDISNKQMIQHFIDHSKYKTVKEIKQYIVLDHDNWMAPAEMKKHGLCDELFKPKKKGETTKEKK